ncbi:MAG: outer membrane beta-barrel protein [Ignavibacteriota bacterium]|jgi:hypothetical protein|nr:MAG: hypothetical protein EDM72_10930 [Chlorobiota bacterium]MBE7478074.1 outer membrane beta-barrel protein [Ignavibacteriales bacterium]MBL1121696.1 hypothetical protein [Ignavibacteriota bacterium]MBV6421243.1 hypothetical protein [Ignavibacteriaceae bacterium]MCE7856386.1 hypothetical protein [Ignavibacteria bacterium CHB3]MEB2297591.1 outer membrane beta-barrel protein [Ignavibacteria bacterium]
MKKILFIYLLTMVFITAYAQESSSKRLGFGIYGGIQLPDDVNLDTGPWFGAFVNFPTGLGWSLQLEYNLWKSNENGADKTVTLSEFPLLVAHKWDIDNVYIQLLFGPGIANVSSENSIYGENSDFSLSFDVALKVGLVITKNADGFIQLRKQLTGSPNFGGGLPAYSSWLVGLGIQYSLN